ncbi:MAG: hypothetical protein MRY74_15185 [Neomegalonema sp.]|nr:hypothetical protein [Neomegalonema sp.]
MDVKRAVIGVVGVAYATALTYGLYVAWSFFELIVRRGGSVPWKRLFGDVKISAEWRKFRLPAWILDLHIPIAVILGVLAVTAAAWIWRRTLGRIDPSADH